ncbi:hypothetical protein EDB85DRAFT_1891985 [Lactarius pseudohatsudake]|nr:hypothetical protein EDB85DRAFT_1891985 [Lactarius pseudohatsudake]
MVKVEGEVGVTPQGTQSGSSSWTGTAACDQGRRRGVCAARGGWTSRKSITPGGCRTIIFMVDGLKQTVEVRWVPFIPVSVFVLVLWNRVWMGLMVAISLCQSSYRHYYSELHQQAKADKLDSERCLADHLRYLRSATPTVFAFMSVKPPNPAIPPSRDAPSFNIPGEERLLQNIVKEVAHVWITCLQELIR